MLVSASHGYVDRFGPGVLGAEDEALAVNVARYCERIVA
jgi:hypothetical protein